MKNSKVKSNNTVFFFTDTILAVSAFIELLWYVVSVSNIMNSAPKEEIGIPMLKITIIFAIAGFITICSRVISGKIFGGE